MNNYFLSPFATISKNDKRYVISSLMDPDKRIAINEISELTPENDDFLNFVFFERSSELVEKYKIQSLEKLETLFAKQTSSIGYIETTNKCPYHCQICPKSWEKQHRFNPEMSLGDFERVISSLSSQDSLALHLFGDPLLDENIFSKVKICNKYGITPSFSTNLISLLWVDTKNFADIRLKQLIISFDSYDEKTLTSIRGKTTKKQISSAAHKLMSLDSLAAETNFVDHIDLQQIMLKVNANQQKEMKKLASQGKKMTYVPKKYINFPLADGCIIGTQEIIRENERVLLYRLIGNLTPFKCLKPWIKRETGITTDGNVVPCCLSLNATAALGNVFEGGLDTIFDSENHRAFRNEIFNNAISKGNATCKMCKVYSHRACYSDENSDAFSFLEKYTILSWSE